MDQCIDGDDREKNLERGSKDSYLLYWWNKLDVEGFMQLTLCTLDKFQRANATDFNIVSYTHNFPSLRVAKDNTHKKVMSDNMGRVGYGITTMSIITACCEIETWQEKLFNLENELKDLEKKSDSSPNRITRM